MSGKVISLILLSLIKINLMCGSLLVFGFD